MALGLTRATVIAVFIAIIISLCTAPVRAQSLVEKGLNELKQENYDEALREFTQARRLDPSSSTAAYFLGLVCKALGNYPDAISNLRDAVTLSPPIKEALPELIDALYVADNLDEATKWMAVGERDNVFPSRIQFLKGLVLLKQNKAAEAIAAFEAAKRYDPSLTQAAEFQIALAHARLGNLGTSRERFQALIAVDPASTLATYAKDYERTITDRLDAQRPFRFSIGTSFKYDSNVNAQPMSGTIFDNPGLAYAVSGAEDTALNTVLNVTYVAPFSFRSPYSLAVQYHLYMDRYFRRDDYNIALQALSVNPGYSWGKFSFVFPLALRYVNLQKDKGTDFINSLNWWPDTRYLLTGGTSPTLRYMVNDRNILEVAYGFMKNTYYHITDDVLPMDPNENRDGWSHSGTAGWTHFFKEGAGILALRYTYADTQTDGSNWSSIENKFSLSLVYPLIERLRLQYTSEASFIAYKNENTIFRMKRRDEVYTNALAFIYEVRKNVDLNIQFSYMRDKCNISTYDYDRSIASAGIEYRF